MNRVESIADSVAGILDVDTYTIVTQLGGAQMVEVSNESIEITIRSKETDQ